MIISYQIQGQPYILYTYSYYFRSSQENIMQNDEEKRSNIGVHKVEMFLFFPLIT